MTRSRFLTLITVSLALLLPLSASADSGTDGAVSFIQARQGELTKLLKAPKSAATDAKIKKVFDRMLSYDALAKNSLKSHWDERSDAEKKEFSCILKHLVQDAYRKNLRKTLNYNVSYKGAAKDKAHYLVKTVAKSRKNVRAESVTIDYVVVKEGGEHRVHDIVTEGSSLVKNYRSQFRRIIKKKGFSGLTSRMKKKLEKNGTQVSCG